MDGRRGLGVGIVFVFAAVLFNSSAALSAGSPTDNQALKAIVQRELPPDYTASIQVTDLHTGTVLMEYNPELPLVPASTLKVVTSAAALRSLNPEFKFITGVLATEVRGSSVGTLYLRGKGDPHLVSEQLFALTSQVLERGIREVRGNIVVDDSYFVPGEPLDESEELGVRAYHAPYGALSLNFNSLKLLIVPGARPGEPATVTCNPASDYARVRSAVRTVEGSQAPNPEITKEPVSSGGELIKVRGVIGVNAGAKGRYVNVASPPLHTGEVFKNYLLRLGVKVEGKVVRGQVPSSAIPILDFESWPLALMVYWLNKYSNNFMAEQLCMAMGAKELGPPGTREKGLEVMRRYLKSLGVDDRTFVLNEASGLSRKNRLSSSVLVKVLLDAMREFSYNYEFISSFGIAGVDGTLQKKFADPDAKRRIRAKTGNLRGINALAGYGLSKDGNVFVFAMIVNRKQQGGEYVDYAEKIIRRVLDLSMKPR